MNYDKLRKQYKYIQKVYQTYQGKIEETTIKSNPSYIVTSMRFYY